MSKENKKLKELLKEYKKQLSEIKNAYIDLTTQDEYGSYYIDEAKLFVEIVGKTIKDFKTENEYMQNELGKGVIDFDNLSSEFSAGQITHYTRLFDGSKTQALLYLWLFNHFSTNGKEVSEDLGRPMYIKLAKVLNRIIEERSDENI